MKLILCLLMIFSFGACTSHHPGSEAEKEAKAAAVKPAYEGHCAMGVCRKVRVPGQAKYSVMYRGNKYLFSTEDARDDFLSDIDKNIKKANREWEMAKGTQVKP
jgi:YHS domain-containing protein